MGTSNNGKIIITKAAQVQKNMYHKRNQEKAFQWVE